MFGPAKRHTPDDALRRRLNDHPATAAALPPLGPLAVTHRTSAGLSGKARYDSVWINHHWAVQHIEHYYEDGLSGAAITLPSWLTSFPLLDSTPRGVGLAPWVASFSGISEPLLLQHEAP